VTRSAGATPYAARRRPRWLWLVGLAFLVVPILEVAVIIAVGRVIGAWPTVLLLLAESALGAWLVRREGGRTWDALREALRTGRMPSRQLTDAGLVLVGGTLLLTPGFVTDLVGFFFLVPVTRPLARRLLERAVARRLVGAAGVAWAPGPRSRPAGWPGRQGAGPGTGSWPGGGGRGDAPPPGGPGAAPPRVVQGEVVDHPTPPPEPPPR
jgi:UPF0716 protein FxsA